ncbi:unnamed protein product [Paramecium sonneborni]|uniref:Uncharacterized protein n=1 Tax=Paramecium sonneborni TaxID=65129 RepID=A0A8S1N7S6_9CILI|nr:unnamed protein product [Paramecium sonneborni]
MKSIKIKTYQYYQKSKINEDALQQTLPYCVKIESSQEDERNDILKLEFDRENCIPLNEVIKYAEILLLRLQHGQIFTIIKHLLSLIENPIYSNQNIFIYNIWLIFDQKQTQRFVLNERCVADFSLFYSFPLIEKTQQNQEQIINIITTILKVCNDIPSSYFFFESKKPFKLFLKELSLGFNQFRQQFHEYYNNNKNIDQKTQTDLNLDTKDEFVEDKENQKKIEKLIQKYIEKSNFNSSLKSILNELLKQYNFQLGLKALNMFQSKEKDKKYELQHLTKLFKFESDEKLNQLIEQTFKKQNEKQDILKQEIEYKETNLLKQNDLKPLYEEAAVIYFKHNGYFNAFDQFIEITEKITTNQLIFEEKFYYIIEPQIIEYYNDILYLKILELIDDLI